MARADRGSDRACAAGLADKVDALAVRIGHSRGWVVKQALPPGWTRRKRNSGLYSKRTDVDAGQLIDHAAILAWADSLSSDDPLPPPQA